MRSILVAFDGSQQSTAALEYAFQTFPDAEFTVLYAPDFDRFESNPTTGNGVLRWLKSSKGYANNLHDTIAQTAERYSVTATSEVVVGKLAKSVVGKCETGEFDQVFVGNYNRSRGRMGLFANVTERIVRRVSLPVTAVGRPANRTFATPPETVVVPVDGSTQASRALEYACQTFPEAKITALHVVDPVILHLDELDTTGWDTGTIEAWEAEIESHSADVESLAESLQDHSNTILERATKRAADHGVELSTVSIEGWPMETILDYVDDNSNDHVCLGCTSQPRYERFILGSVTENMLRDCPVPMTTLRNPPKRD